ncbi:membrane protein [Treponema denticola F0402]|nr:membrane protein [Treponema denticola F0402]
MVGSKKYIYILLIYLLVTYIYLIIYAIINKYKMNDMLFMLRIYSWMLLIHFGVLIFGKKTLFNYIKNTFGLQIFMLVLGFIYLVVYLFIIFNTTDFNRYMWSFVGLGIVSAAFCTFFYLRIIEE